jgi:5-carboxymethyl-2-hydroxymuconate isomerase
MPHITIEYTPNLAAEVRQTDLINAVHQAAVDTKVFPLWGIRTLARPAESSRVAHGDPVVGFIQITLRIAPGRDLATRQRVTQVLFDAVLRQTAQVREQRELGIQLEVTEFDQDVCLNWNNLKTPKG